MSIDGVSANGLQIGNIYLSTGDATPTDPVLDAQPSTPTTSTTSSTSTSSTSSAAAQPVDTYEAGLQQAQSFTYGVIFSSMSGGAVAAPDVSSLDSLAQAAASKDLAAQNDQRGAASTATSPLDDPNAATNASVIAAYAPPTVTDPTLQGIG